MVIFKFSIIGFVCYVTNFLFKAEEYAIGAILRYLISPFICAIICLAIFLLLKKYIPSKKYTIAFTDTISSIGFVGTRKGEIVCINNAGKELFEVYKIDNGPDYVSDGLFRIVEKNSKIGFADTCGAIVIPPVFSYATPFHNGEAKVSFGGKNEKQGEYQSWKSNLWFLIKKSK